MTGSLPEDDLPPRRETFLAHYPRAYKLTATALLLALFILPPLFIHDRLHRKGAPGRHAAAAPSDTDASPTAPAAGVKADSDIHAEALNNQEDRSVKLSQAPDSRVTEDDAQGGNLPRVSESGLRPWQVYARPFNTADKRPRIALVVTGLGLSRTVTDEAIDQLPPPVTLAFDANGPVIGAWANRARQDGHEILLQVPMEPFDFPRSDPGPQTLLTALPNSDNIARLLTSMRKMSGYVGVTTLSGSRFCTDPAKLAPVISVLHDRGLIAFDAHAAPHSAFADLAHQAGVPTAMVTQRLDGDLNPDSLTAAFADLEKIAQVNGRAIGMMAPTPVGLTQAQAWLKTLPDRGIALAPLSAMVQ